MKTIVEIKKILNDYRDSLRQRFGVARIAVFGSYSRGDQTPTSDLDLMVEFERPIGWEFVSLCETLEQILQLKVDVATPAMLTAKPRLWRSVREDLQYV